MSHTPLTGDDTPVDARYALVAVEALRPHETVDAARVASTTTRLSADGVLRQPIIVDAETRVVLDGHHRLAALKRLGAARAPVHLVDYSDPRVGVVAWRDGETPPTKEDVLAHALKGELYPPKTTRHPVLYGLPEAPTPLADLGVSGNPGED